jgi:cytoskeletal protein CcmA (bactofilin family)
VETVIAAGASIEGTVRCEGALHVDGRIQGSVESVSTVSVGADGMIKGDVLADEVTVGGRIEGTVIAASRLHMLSTGAIYGDARYGSLEVDRGGLIEGRTIPISGLASPAPETPIADDALVEIAPAPDSAATRLTPPPPAPEAPALPAALRESTPPPAPRESTPPPMPGAGFSAPATGKARPLPSPRPLDKDKTVVRPPPSTTSS